LVSTISRAISSTPTLGAQAKLGSGHHVNSSAGFKEAGHRRGETDKADAF
jgi:hypothetical protein